MTTHKINKGFDLPLAGRPEHVLADAPEPALVGIETAEFAGIKPKVLVKEGDTVKTGQPIYCNKLDRDIVWCSPVTGTVKEIVYGARRYLQRVVIERSGDDDFVELPKAGGDRAAPCGCRAAHPTRAAARHNWRCSPPAPSSDAIDAPRPGTRAS